MTGTLLNRLFGTNFDVMDETKRQQTTKGLLSFVCSQRHIYSIAGIWMCRGQGMNVLVMDVEGTDGRERGEDQVCCVQFYLPFIDLRCRISSGNLPCFHWLRLKFL
jgi:hypothetical protein